MRNYEANYKVEPPSEMDKMNWKWVLPTLAVLAFIGMIVVMIMNSGIVAYIGFGVFAILGFLAGQSRWWHTMRKMSGYYFNKETGEDEE